MFIVGIIYVRVVVLLFPFVKSVCVKVVSLVLAVVNPCKISPVNLICWNLARIEYFYFPSLSLYPDVFILTLSLHNEVSVIPFKGIFLSNFPFPER